MAFSSEQISKLTRASNDFTYFANNILSESVETFIPGDYVDQSCRFLSQNDRTIKVSARHHFKSFSIYAYIMWKILFEGAHQNLEIHYFSFNKSMAGYHVKKLKENIEANPFFDDLIDLKKNAETVGAYTWDGKKEISITPHGMVQFKRGIHGDLIFVDDPLQDPDSELNPTVVYKINEIFSSNILDMPNKPNGELHVVGTPQTKQDFFFQDNITNSFRVWIAPAIQEDEETGIKKALWPEWMSLEDLEAKRDERTERIFQKEFMCQPVQSTKSFFKESDLRDRAVNNNLVNLDPHKKHPELKNLKIVAGFDIGKKKDPSHLAVFKLEGNVLKMIHSRFMDGWPYSKKGEFRETRPSQIEYLRMVIENFYIDELRYDNTRSEFEIFDDQGILPRQMIPMKLTSKTRNPIATNFDKIVEREQLEIFDNKKLINQITSVNNALKAPRNKDGHGDAFWSIGLGVLGGVNELGLEEIESTPGIDRVTPTTGGSSLFGAGSSVPKGW